MIYQRFSLSSDSLKKGIFELIDLLAVPQDVNQMFYNAFYYASQPANKTVLGGLILSLINRSQTVNGITYNYWLRISRGAFVVDKYLGLLKADINIPIDEAIQKVIPSIASNLNNTNATQNSEILPLLVRQLQRDYLYQPVIWLRLNSRYLIELFARESQDAQEQLIWKSDYLAYLYSSNLQAGDSKREQSYSRNNQANLNLAFNFEYIDLLGSLIQIDKFGLYDFLGLDSSIDSEESLQAQANKLVGTFDFNQLLNNQISEYLKQYVQAKLDNDWLAQTQARQDLVSLLNTYFVSDIDNQPSRYSYLLISSFETGDSSTSNDSNSASNSASNFGTSLSNH